MDTQVTLFNFNGADLRTVMHNGDPWFVATDVAEALDLTDGKTSIRRLDPDEVHTMPLLSAGGTQNTTIISESGLYSLTLRSRRPEAKRFKKWVTSEVLPTIRKTGAYIQPAATSITVMEVAPLAGDSPPWAIDLMRALGGATVEMKRDMTQVKADTQANTAELQRIAAAQEQEARWRHEHNAEATHALVGDFKRIKDQVVPQLVSRRPDLKQAEAARRFHGEFTRWCKAAADIHGTLTPGLITVSQGQRLVEKAIERTRELGVSGVSVPQRFAS
jgi:prophage antirepressor-like protein